MRNKSSLRRLIIMCFVVLALLASFTSALRPGECWHYVNGTFCLNGTTAISPGNLVIEGSKINASEILNPPWVTVAGSDNNNYTSGISYSGKTLSLTRIGLSTLTADIPNNAITLSILNITGSDSNQCTGTNKVMNVSFVNGELSILCDTDQTGGGSGDLTDVIGGYGINVTNGAGPAPTIDVNRTLLDTIYYLASNPSGYISDGNTGWDNSYGFITNFQFNVSNGTTSSQVNNNTRINITASTGIRVQLTGTDFVITNTVTDTNDTGLYFTKADTITTFVNRSLWTTHDNYPSDCSSGNYVSGIGDTLTCSIPPGVTNAHQHSFLNITSTFHNGQVGLASINNQSLNTTNSGATGQYLTLGSNHQFTWATLAGGGDLTDVFAGIGINVTNGAGPTPTIEANLTYLNTWFALQSGIDGSNITSGTVADARIESTITRDSEVPSLETDSISTPKILYLNASKGGLGSVQCSGTDKLYNITLTNTSLTGLCAADQTGASVGDGTGGWLNTSAYTTTTLDLNITNTTGGMKFFVNSTTGAVRINNTDPSNGDMLRVNGNVNISSSSGQLYFGNGADIYINTTDICFRSPPNSTGARSMMCATKPSG